MALLEVQHKDTDKQILKFEHTRPSEIDQNWLHSESLLRAWALSMSFLALRKLPEQK